MTTPANVNVQVGDLVLFTQAAGHWNRDRPYRVAATTDANINVECDGHHYNIAWGDLEGLGFKLATEK